MHPSLRLCASAAPRQPLIHFVGKRQWSALLYRCMRVQHSLIPTESEQPHPHPLAAPDLKSVFTESLMKLQASTPQASAAGSAPSQQAKGNTQAYENFWDAPERYWKHDLNEWEVELVSVRSEIPPSPPFRHLNGLPYRREARRGSRRALLGSWTLLYT